MKVHELLGWNLPPYYVNVENFVRFYIKNNDIEKFKNTLVEEYNRAIDEFILYYETLNKSENAGWEFENFPKKLTDGDIEVFENGICIKPGRYFIEIYGFEVPIPVEYDCITEVFDNIKGFEYEYEGFITEVPDSKYPDAAFCIIGNVRDFSYTYGKIKEKINYIAEEMVEMDGEMTIEEAIDILQAGTKMNLK